MAVVRALLDCARVVRGYSAPPQHVAVRTCPLPLCFLFLPGLLRTVDAVGFVVDLVS